MKLNYFVGYKILERKIAKTRPTMFLKRSPTNKLRVSHFYFIFMVFGFGRVDFQKFQRISLYGRNRTKIETLLYLLVPYTGLKSGQYVQRGSRVRGDLRRGPAGVLAET